MQGMLSIVFPEIGKLGGNAVIGGEDVPPVEKEGGAVIEYILITPVVAYLYRRVIGW